MSRVTAARVAALCAAVLAAGSASADSLGTLFTTEAERARLDAGHGGAAGAVAAAPTDAPQASPVEELKLNGTLVSRDGKRQIWINGRGQFDGAGGRQSDAQLVSRDQVRLHNTGAGPRLIKPGQIINPSTGELRESFQRDTAQQTPAEQQDATGE